MSWRAGLTTAQRGYGSRWQYARKHFLWHHPLCAMCKRKGVIKRATDVDHVIPHKGDRELFWNRENWQALCGPCHDQEKRLLEMGKLVMQTGVDGWPT